MRGRKPLLRTSVVKKTKMNSLISPPFLKKGDKVRLTLEFKGRAITKQEFGREHFDRIFVETVEFASIEIAPKMLGKKMMAQLMPIKKK